MSRSQMSRTPLSTHTGVLRASLLLSLGLSPLACGGTAVTASNGDGGSSAQTGTAAQGGRLGGPGGGGSTSSTGGAGAAGSSESGGDAGLGGDAGAGGTNSAVTCTNPVVDPVTQFVSCEGGLVHRTQRLVCTFDSSPGQGGAGGTASGNGGAAGAVALLSRCQVHADCASLPYGYCERVPNPNPVEEKINRCRSGCASDSDCGGGICACDGGTPGRCISANCQIDGDCPANSLCAFVPGICGNGGSFQCTSPLDECISSADCGPGESCLVQSDHRTCSQVACGRPFLIAEAPRMAAIESRADWLHATLTPNVGGLAPLQRAQLAAHWARLGQMEHASIAAFARFNLQLLSLGAPSDLVEACNRALADETAHARACFALASAYGGTAVGPARLDIEHCFEGTSLVAIAKLVLREGCIGETAASLEALAAAEVASDSAVKQALTRIARDELSHAELAFKFLRWALTLASVEERHDLAREAARQLADFEHHARSGGSARTHDLLASHGLISGDALRAIHLAAARDVTRPLLAALFDVQESNHV